MKHEDTTFGTSRALVLSQQSAQRELETRRWVKLAKRANAEVDMLESLQSRGYIVNGAEPLKKPHEVRFFRRLSSAPAGEKPGHISPPSKSDSHEKIQTGEADARNGALSVVLRKVQASAPPRTLNLHPVQGANRTAKRHLYFFSWSSDTTDHAPTARPISNSANDDDGLQFLSYVLTRVHEKITDSNFDLMTGKTRQDTSFPQMAAQAADIFQHQQPHLNLQSVGFDEIYQPIYQPSKTGDSDEDEQLHDINEIVDQILKETREIVALFAPLEFPHDLLKRIWGALAVIRKAKQLAKENSSSGDVDSSGTAKLSWSVRRQEYGFQAAENGIPQPTKAFHDCLECERKTAYECVSHAVDHVTVDYYKLLGVEPDYEVQREKSLFWVYTSQQQAAETWNQAYIDVLKAYHYVTQRVYKQSLEIWYAVANYKEAGDGATEGSRRTGLPAALVRTFESLTVLILCTARTIKFLESRHKEKQDAKADELLRISRHLDVLTRISVRVFSSMEKAQKDITLMLRGNSPLQSVNFAAAGPRLIISTIFHQLAQRRFCDGKRPLTVYEEIASSLQYKAYYDRPTRRLLTTTERFQEELEALRLLLNDVDRTWTNFIDLGRTESFRISDQNRAQQFQLEHKVYKSARHAREGDLRKIDDLQKRLRKIEYRIRQRIEIQDEDHGKAIMIFTIVTIIFLPLSFVTSFLGMNTTDIRDTNYSQSLFWIIALPVTALVLGITGIFVWEGDTIRDWLLERSWAGSRVTSRKDHNYFDTRKLARVARLKHKQTEQWSSRRRQVSFKDDLEMNR
ncbi:hypothetical protein E8E14_014674 [Neopestalotiopsis sp. 37M]|nr:hypothetical protein E8E14_014674 [Neopestalotiopsis sp. 37M]